MHFTETFFKEEIRNNYTISSKMKEVWSVELNILEQIDNICQKHNIKYFSYYGTLLGAIRHKGFIPWDDDIDIAMLRSDYEKFRIVATKELSFPYNYVGECDNGIIRAHAKVENEQTSAIIIPDNYTAHQGIFVDIFPIDDLPDGSIKKNKLFKMQMELWKCIYSPELIIETINSNTNFNFELSIDMINQILKMTPLERTSLFSSFCLNNFGESQNLGYFYDFVEGRNTNLKPEYFEEIEYTKFENILIPIPKHYDIILTDAYGNYLTPVMNSSYHEGCSFSTTQSYKDRI